MPDGAALLCGNHTSLWDPVFLALALGPGFRPYFMGKAELVQTPVFGRILKALGVFPVKRGTADIQAVKTSLRILGQGDKLIMFPEGTRVDVGEAAEAKKGVSMLADRTGAVIVPVFLKTAPVRLFGKVIVRFGAPIRMEKPEGYPAGKGTAEQYRALADTVMERIRVMGERA